MKTNKNFLVSMALCVIAWIAVEFGLKKNPPPPPPSPVSAVTKTVVPPPHRILSGPTVTIENDCLKASLYLKGMFLTESILKKYTVKKGKATESVNVWELSPFYGLVSSWEKSPNLIIPDENTLWSTNNTHLTPDSPVTLTWTNPQNIKFSVYITLDKNYLLSFFYRVTNTTEKTIHVSPILSIERAGPVPLEKNSNVYEGPLGVFQGSLKEIGYNEKQVGTSAAKTHTYAMNNTDNVGWLGVTSKYWLTAIFPSISGRAIAHTYSDASPLTHHYVMKHDITAIPEGKTQEWVSHAFVGPKNLSTLEQYEKTYSVDHFDLAVDFGWFYFLTKPLFRILSFLNSMLGGFGWAILALTVIIKALFFPLSLTSHRSMARIRTLQPRLEALKKQYGNDKMRLNQEIMQLYKNENVNPASGCLPMLIQIPVFFALYKVLSVSIEMREASFFWIHDLSIPDPLSLLTLCGLIPITLPDWMNVGLWPLFMGITMFLQQRTGSASITDPQQKFMMTYILPIIFTVMLARFPVGLVIYWTWSNMLTLIQQWVLSRYYTQPQIAQIS